MRSSDDAVPVLGMAQAVLFPGMAYVVPLTTVRARGAIDEALQATGDVAVFTVRPNAASEPEPTDLYTTGTLAHVTAIGICPCCQRQVAKLHGTRRIRSFVFLFRVSDPCHHVLCAQTPTELDPEDGARPIAAAVSQAAAEIRLRFPRCAAARRAVENLRDRTPEEVLGAAIALLGHLSVQEKQRILELDTLSLRLLAVRHELNRRLATADVPQDRRESLVN
jgi:ATP-dependent Lon protease